MFITHNYTERSNTFQLGLQNKTNVPPWNDPISRWELGAQPLWINFSDPTITHLKDNVQWDIDPTFYHMGVVNQNTVDAADQWIYLLITSTNFPSFAPGKTFIPAAHPIHLHGHDFAIVAQSSKPYWDSFVVIKQDNPPRRDVALLPANGYLIIAFKSDNPGSWLMHCHIAWHASAGLGMC